MPKAYSYIRFSSRAQATGGSLERQIEMSAAYCAKHGWDLDDSLRDLGRSAYRGEHAKFGALGKFIEMARGGEIQKGSWLIVESFDRLGRDEILSAVNRFITILECGIRIVTLSDGRQWTRESVNAGFADFVISIVIMARAHDESAMKSQRAAHNWKKARERAGEIKMTAICPGWLRLVEDRKSFEVLPERAAIVRRIFNETLAGVGREMIAKRLNQEGIPAFRGKYGWHQSSIAKILENQAVIGAFQPHRKIDGKPVPEGEPISGYFPAVIDKGVFWRVQARRRPPSGRKGRLLTNLFTGLARCASCGSNMVFIDKGEPPRGGKYLMCGRAKRGLCDQKTRHRYPALEAEMIWSLRLFGFWRLLRPPADGRADALAAEIKSKRATADNLLAKASATTAAPIVRRIETLYAEAEAAKEQLETLTAERAQTPPDFDVLLRMLASPTLPADERYTLRSRIAAEMRRLIAEMVADGDCILVRMKSAPNHRVELRLVGGRIERLNLWSRDWADPDYPNNPMTPAWRPLKREQLSDEEMVGLFDQFVGQ